MFETIKSALGVLRQGQAIAAAAKVKNWQMVGNGIAGLLGIVIGIAKVHGHDIPLSHDDLVVLGSGAAILLGVLNPIATVITSDKVGLPAKPSSYLVLHADPAPPADPVKPSGDWVSPVDSPAQPASAASDADYAGGN